MQGVSLCKTFCHDAPAATSIRPRRLLCREHSRSGITSPSRSISRSDRVLSLLLAVLPGILAFLVALVVLHPDRHGLSAVLRRGLAAAKFDERLARGAAIPIGRHPLRPPRSSPASPSGPASCSGWSSASPPSTPPTPRPPCSPAPCCPTSPASWARSSCSSPALFSRASWRVPS
jgi:hypothetical protein